MCFGIGRKCGQKCLEDFSEVLEEAYKIFTKCEGFTKTKIKVAHPAIFGESTRKIIINNDKNTNSNSIEIDCNYKFEYAEWIKWFWRLVLLVIASGVFFKLMCLCKCCK